MDIIACYKIVPDEQDAAVLPDRTLSFDRAALKIGDYDLNAIEAGANLATAHDAKLVSMTVGDSAVEDSKIKKSVLARGPQENIALKDDAFAHASSSLTARALQALIGHYGSFDLVLCGEGSADLYSQQVGIQLGELLGVPTINSVSSIELDGTVARVERTIDNQVEELEVPLPAVISVVADMNVPRIPSMKDILGAGKKPSAVLAPGDLGLADLSDPVETVSTCAPETKARACDVAEGDSDEAIKEFIAKIQAQA